MGAKLRHQEMILKIHPENPELRKIEKLAGILMDGGVAICPTDTIYAFICDLRQFKAFESICRLKSVKTDKANFSLLCRDLANISAYTKPFDRQVYKILNRALPGPYTFILDAGSEVPAMFRSRKRTIGLRVPDHPVIQALLDTVGFPLVASSLHDSDSIREYPTDPEEIAMEWEKKVDVVVDGGFGRLVPSTVIDLTGDSPVIMREGAGDASGLF